MADVAPLKQLKPTSCQLPVSWYFDPEIFEAEKRLLFQSGPNYVGHELMVPNAGDWHTLAWMDHAKVLVRNGENPATAGISLLSNVCRHRQAIMLEGRGNAENIVCPVHRWTYDLKGELLGAPRFADQPCVKLASTPLANWNGLLFAGPRDPARDLARITTNADWNFSGYVLDSVRIDEYDINWKTFIETYLEVYHVDFFHPGLGNFTDCNNFTVDYGTDYSVQIVEAKAGLARPGEQQPVPVDERRRAQLHAGAFREVRRAQQLALQVIGPAVQRADDAFDVAAPFQQDRLPVAADVRQQLDAGLISDQELRMTGPAERMVVADLGDHQLVADVVRAGVEQEPFLELEDGGIEVPGRRQVATRRLDLAQARNVRHAL